MKELEDLPWFPAMFRRFQLQYIGSLVQWLHIYRPLMPHLLQLVENCQPQQMQDLCSGGGEPVRYYRSQLPQLPACYLSDKFPDTDFTNEPGLHYLPQSVDVLTLEPQPSTCCTMFNGFHHFTTAQQQELVRKMAHSRSPFLFAEILEPGPITLLKIIIMTTVAQAVTAPFVRPVSYKRLFFTWIIPVNLFTVLYDGVISVFKSKTAAAYRRQLEHLGNAQYAVTVNSRFNWKGRLIFITGTPLT